MENTFLLLAIVCFVAMVSPGPDFVLVTRNALLFPRAQAFATAVGIICGCLFHATYCILGLAVIIAQSVILFSAIKYLGAIYLIYLGIKSLFASSATSLTAQVDRSFTMPSVREAFFQGFLCNVLNPKLAVFLLSLFTQFIDVEASTADKVRVAGIFVGESAVYWPLLVLLLQSPAIRGLFSSMKIVLDKVCGALLVYLGVRVAMGEE